MSSMGFKKGSYQESKRFSNCNTFELLLILCGFITWIGVEKFNLNVIATFVVTFIISMILFYTRLNHLLIVIFSVAWGVVGFQLFQYLVSITGGEITLSYVIGIIGFILASLISFIKRSMDKQYYTDIEDEM
ncbi:hypothetical protein [Paenisporosarcina antarctica]|uniref:Uncharacterized protein n=1 Tax=Paenisporosarcina antarctica TaxID=417367 RepID=A0A4P6ZYG9_9BACL|nr:hypothetical protein [Paenisporosarcina antarctica]QBP41258.1 hypothetical protein E2636_08965 [Paenisporosarcina antarctica]